MAAINRKRKEIQAKIVYYGPLRAGKTTNLEYILGMVAGSAKIEIRPEMVQPKNFNICRKLVGKYELFSVKNEGGQTEFCDFLGLHAGIVNGYNVKLQIYTVAGAQHYVSARKVVLNGSDGVVFVADSLKVRREKNMLRMKELEENLRSHNISIFKLPLVLQYNKRDLRQKGIPLMSIERMETELNGQLKAPSFDASAHTGYNVFRTLKTVVNMVMVSLKNEIV